MTVTPLALSLSSDFTKAGAIAGFAALLGIAILSLLVFSQARELKRLREWAGRAPERAAEVEQRVSAEASARLQQPAAPTQPAAATQSAVRAVPRTVPLNARAVPATGEQTAVPGAP
ncbi:MAG: hypothetical protein ACYDHT_11625, partial [Solirubrobacteraceae bacterium]